MENLADQIDDESIQALIDQDLVGTYIIQDGLFKYVNHKLARTFGYDADEIIDSLGPEDLTAEQDRDTVKKNIEKRLKDDTESIRYSFQGIKKDGTTFPVTVHGSRSSFNDKPAVIGVLVKKSRLKLAKKTIHTLAMDLTNYSADKLFNNLVKNIAETLDVDYVMINGFDKDNRTASTIAFYNHGEIAEDFTYQLVNTPCEEIFHGEECFYPSNVQETFPEDKSLQELNIESYVGIPLTSLEGDVIGLLTIMDQTPLPDPDTCRVILRLFGNRAESELARRNKSQRVEELAYYDSLTQLHNRRYFYRKLNEKIDSIKNTSEKLAVLFLDLDGFKLVNNAFGHRVGDKVLQRVSERLTNTIDEGIISRWGGDEFTILLPDITSFKEPEQKAQELLDELSKEFKVNGNTFHMLASIGIVVAPDTAMNRDDLIRRADIAMFQAKEKPGSTYQVFVPSGEGGNQKQITLQHELQSALDSGQFTLHYQPLFDLSRNKIVGLEALIRWAHPERGQIFPGGFIPLAEATGLILPIGEWVLREACSQLQTWRSEISNSIRVNVNVSARQFQDDEFEDKVMNILDETGLPAESLELEITETTIVNDLEQANEVISNFRDRGISVSMDDFGTGYSSLLYLSQFPIDSIKIDRTFTRMITKDDSKFESETLQILKTVASELNLRVVAEGIETREQFKTMKSIGCDELQGYLLGRPNPASTISDWLSEDITAEEIMEESF